MKINKQILVAVLGLGIAASAQADSWSNVSPNSIIVFPGETGTTVFSFTDNSQNITFSPAVATQTPFLTFFSSVSVISAVTTANSDTVTVQWTVASAPPVSTDFISTTVLGGTTELETAATDYKIAAAPEPAQTVAGAMLLGCGGLVFAGRRLFTKKSA